MNSFKKAAIESVDSMAELYKSIADEIWENPELSFKEYKAAGLYCKVLRDNGFAVTEKLCGIDTAFCGSFGHGCSHNLLGVGSLAAAFAVKEYLQKAATAARSCSLSARLRRVQSR